MPSVSVPTALLIGTGVSAAGGVASGILGSNAAHDAARLQNQAAQMAARNQMAMFEQTQANLKPYMDAGGLALKESENLLGLGDSSPGQIQSFLEKTPGYQFTRDQGLKSVQNSFAAKGLGSSGAALRGAADYTTGLANQTYETRLADYLGLAGRGQNAAAGLGALGQEAAATAGGFSTSGAAALAAGEVGSANAWGGAINGLTGSLSSLAMLQALSGGGMFGAGTAPAASSSDAFRNPTWGAGNALAPQGGGG